MKQKVKTIKVKYVNPPENFSKIEKIDKGDWIDLYAAEDVEFKAGDHKLIRLGVAIQLPTGYEAYLAPRSSTFKTWGLIVANSFGIIDESYCGNEDEWKLSAYAMRDTKVHKNDKICQFRIVKKQPYLKIKEVAELKNKNRGGFGSTGSK